MSEFDLSRLRRGELIVGCSALVLLALMLLAPWYGLTPVFARTAAALGRSTEVSGWNALTHLRWLMLVTVIAGVSLTYFQAARRAPAVPVSLSVIVTVLGVLTALALVYRVLINVPGPDNLLEQKLGSYLGSVSALALVYGAYRSLRTEGIAAKDAPREVETVRLARS